VSAETFLSATGAGLRRIGKDDNTLPTVAAVSTIGFGTAAATVEATGTTPAGAVTAAAATTTACRAARHIGAIAARAT